MARGGEGALYPFEECNYKGQDGAQQYLHSFKGPARLIPHLQLIFTFMSEELQDIRADTSYEGVSKSFRTGRLERELKMVQLSATRCNCIAIL
jgi:hypothetical protein